MSADIEDLKARAIAASFEAKTAENKFLEAAAASRALCDEYAAAMSPLEPGDVVETVRARRRYRIESVTACGWQFSDRWRNEPRARYRATCIRKDGTMGETTDDFWQAETPSYYVVIERASAPKAAGDGREG